MADGLFDKASEMFDKSVDAASEMFDKSRDAASDMFDKSRDIASDLANQAGDFATRSRIKAKIAEQSLEHDRLMKKLGETIYDQVKDDPAYTDNNKSLFVEIEACNTRLQELKDELSREDAASASEKVIDVEPAEPEEKENAADDVAAEASKVAEQDSDNK
ncbi:MAG: hypothetical protein ACOX69_03845 [Coriobacteriales bacterium]|jgi:hypothetical protein